MSQLSRKITGIEKIFKTWDLYQSILYTLEDYFLNKTKIFNPGFFFTDRLVVLPYKAKWHLRGQITKGSTFSSDRMLWNHSYSISLYPTSEKKCGHFLNTHHHFIRRGERKRNPILLLTYSQIWFSSFLIQFWIYLKSDDIFFLKLGIRK